MEGVRQPKKTVFPRYSLSAGRWVRQAQFARDPLLASPQEFSAVVAVRPPIAFTPRGNWPTGPNGFGGVAPVGERQSRARARNTSCTRSWCARASAAGCGGPVPVFRSRLYLTWKRLAIVETR